MTYVTKVTVAHELLAYFCKRKTSLKKAKLVIERKVT